jgi:hypothetical protein
MSYANMVLYGASLPTYHSKSDKESDKDTINADDPANKQKVREFLDSID